MDSDKIFSKDKLKVHMFYIIVILILALVVVITDRGYDNKDLSQWIAFGATLSGIILSVLAIILTLIGETKSDNTKDSLLDTSKKLEDIVDNIENATLRLEEAKNENEKIRILFADKKFNIHDDKYFEENEDKILKTDTYYIEVFKNLIKYFAQKNANYMNTMIQKSMYILFYWQINIYKFNVEKSIIADEILEVLNLEGSSLIKKDDIRLVIVSGIIVVFVPILRIKQENKFNKYIEKEVKNKYPKEKKKIDRIFK
ncbi:hypothetical protein JY742_18230 [Clostridioides difficile]|nr:hypothetical protein [Clostridioides difficile]